MAEQGASEGPVASFLVDATDPPVAGGEDLFGTAPLEFTCPRCGIAASATYYGPCDDCRTMLRSSLGTAARRVEVGEYEPKMNVTPNAVATKD